MEKPYADAADGALTRALHEAGFLSLVRKGAELGAGRGLCGHLMMAEALADSALVSTRILRDGGSRGHCSFPGAGMSPGSTDAASPASPPSAT